MYANEEKVNIKTSRAGGPGGQNVNKRSTKVQLQVKVSDLNLADEEKEKIRKKLKNHIDHDDELRVESEEERSQERNREIAFEKLNNLIGEVLEDNPKRIPTRSPLRANEDRLKHKHARYQKKKARREASVTDVENHL